MAHTTMYRLFKTSWGISIELTAEARSLSSYPGQAMHVADDVFLAVDAPPYLTAVEQEYLARGLRLVADQVRAQNAVALPVVVHVQTLDFRPSDFQPEGLACALAQWAAEAFGFRALDVPITFDHRRNRYEFHFERIERPSRHS